jgi:hypothetical protein
MGEMCRKIKMDQAGGKMGLPDTGAEMRRGCESVQNPL